MIRIYIFSFLPHFKHFTALHYSYYVTSGFHIVSYHCISIVWQHEQFVDNANSIAVVPLDTISIPP